MDSDQNKLASAAKLQRALNLLSEAVAESMATGSATAYARLEEATKMVEDARKGTDEAKVNPFDARHNYELQTQVGVTDTTGTSGITEHASLVKAATVFGHPLQRFVASTAFQSAPDPNTVVVTLTQSPDSTREQVLRAAGVLPDEEKDTKE